MENNLILFYLWQGLPQVPHVTFPLPLIKDFSHIIYPVFILLLLYLYHLYSSLTIFSLFWSILINTQTWYEYCPSFKNVLRSYTTSVPFFCFPLLWILRKLSVFCLHFLTSKSPLNLLLGDFPTKPFLSRSAMTFMYQIQRSILYPHLHYMKI